MACGPFGKWGSWAVRDVIGEFDMTVPCKWHDHAYANPEGRSKKQIDKIFLAMLLVRAGDSAHYRRIAYFRYWVVSRGRLCWWWCRLKDKWRS